MLAEEIDFHRIFQINPTVMVLLTADFVIVDANDEALHAVGLSLDEVVGRNAYEIVPKMPDASGQPEWSALEEAVTSGHSEGWQLKRHEMEDPANPGVYEERYWSTMVRPVRGFDGRVEMVEFSAREVTPIIEQYRGLQAEQA